MVHGIQVMALKLYELAKKKVFMGSKEMYMEADCIKNEDVRKELNIFAISKMTGVYRSKWKSNMQ